MTLEKAIETLTIETNELIPGVNDDYIDAVKLGAEALKHLQKQRRYNLAFHDELLPGETKF